MKAIETRICKALDERGPSVIGDSEKSAAMFHSLSERGYVRLGRGRSGPLGVYTGETVATLTEAGRAAINPVLGAAGMSCTGHDTSGPPKGGR